MNVLFAYAFCGLGGVETAILNRCDALHRRGVSSTVFFREFYGTGAADFAGRSNVRVGLHHVPELARRRFDVVCVVDYPDFVPIARREMPQAALLLETHASITARLLDFHRLADDPSVAAVIVPSRFNRDLLLRVSEGRRPIHVVPNGIDVSAFTRLDESGLRQRFDGLADKTILLWVGRLEDEKNPRGFMRLCARMSSLGAGFHFICIGDAPQDPEYRARLQEAVPSSNREDYTFIASVPYRDMPLYYSLAAATGGCLISTSLFESVPMIFLESMACECPVVSTRVGGVSEILIDQVTAVLFDPEDDAAACEAVQKVVGGNARGLRTHLIERARAYVNDHHSLDVAGEHFVRILDAASGAAEPANSPGK